jgi:hypothetical protein
MIDLFGNSSWIDSNMIERRLSSILVADWYSVEWLIELSEQPSVDKK